MKPYLALFETWNVFSLLCCYFRANIANNNTLFPCYKCLQKISPPRHDFLTSGLRNFVSQGLPEMPFAWLVCLSRHGSYVMFSPIERIEIALSQFHHRSNHHEDVQIPSTLPEITTTALWTLDAECDKYTVLKLSGKVSSKFARKLTNPAIPLVVYNVIHHLIGPSALAPITSSMYHMGAGTRPCPFPVTGNGHGRDTEPKGDQLSGRNGPDP